MKTSAVITEYNPFHNGHKYQLEEIKKLNNNPLIVIMSGSFTQRGAPSIINKFKKAELAVENGANLVIELPVIYSTSNAEIFSKGAINILNSLNVVDNLYFGAEDNLNTLLSISNKIKENKDNINSSIKKYLDLGYSYLKSYELSLDFLSKEEINVIRKPNNILAFEYIKAIDDFNLSIKPNVILRKDVSHGSSITTKNFSSASNIRELAYKKDFNKVKDFVPKNTFKALNSEDLNDFNNYFNIFKYLVLEGNINYKSYYDYEDGMENRFLKFIDINNINEFISLVSTKRYTKSRVARLIINIVLDVNSTLIKKSFNSPYIRVLAMDSIGSRVLKTIDNENLINKFSKTKNIKDSTLREIIDKEVFATNLYNLYTSKIINEDFLKSPIYIKRT